MPGKDEFPMENYLNLPGDEGAELGFVHHGNTASSTRTSGQIHAQAAEGGITMDEFTKESINFEREFVQESFLAMTLMSPLTAPFDGGLYDPEDEFLLSPMISPSLNPSPALTTSNSMILSECTPLPSPTLMPDQGIVAFQAPGPKRKSDRSGNKGTHPLAGSAKSPRLMAGSTVMPLDAMIALPPPIMSLQGRALNENNFTPITRSKLTKLDMKSDHVQSATECITSPRVKPVAPLAEKSLDEAEIKKLTEQSNYQIVASGESENLGLNYRQDLALGLEIRKSNHKIAEQRRRDSMKKCFDEMREILPNLTEKNPSKLYILQKSCEYIREMQEREVALIKELDILRKQTD